MLNVFEPIKPISASHVAFYQTGHLESCVGRHQHCSNISLISDLTFGFKFTDRWHVRLTQIRSLRHSEQPTTFKCLLCKPHHLSLFTFKRIIWYRKRTFMYCLNDLNDLKLNFHANTHSAASSKNGKWMANQMALSVDFRLKLSFSSVSGNFLSIWRSDSHANSTTSTTIILFAFCVTFAYNGREISFKIS